MKLGKQSIRVEKMKNSTIIIIAKYFVNSEKYCYLHVTKEENGKNERCRDRSQNHLFAKLKRTHQFFVEVYNTHCIDITLWYAEKC